ncbi:cardioacceleratory peptide receptor isoform X2 [Cephus cinctus]|uniref:Cardioacceleratory peptide receptor isoform X2 n=1 Tax=Cephus cinctus TaxID=211228 RepID=A0AAJ7CEL4_CEPCN|nr:cardioacceleratory peptide receptor isoform X2 [Cephus cinctus]
MSVSFEKYMKSESTARDRYRKNGVDLAESPLGVMELEDVLEDVVNVGANRISGLKTQVGRNISEHFEPLSSDSVFSLAAGNVAGSGVSAGSVVSVGAPGDAGSSGDSDDGCGGGAALRSVAGAAAMPGNGSSGFYLESGYPNVTSSAANASNEIDSFYFYETEQFTVLWLLFAVIVAGNTAVLVGLLLGKRRKSRMDFFIKQLAFADLLVGLISVLTDIVWRTTVTWHAGNVACKLIRFMQVVVTYSSTYVLVALSIDRYDAITRPMNFSRSWARARALVASAWGLSVLFSVPIIFLYEEKLIQDTTQCWIDLGTPTQWRIYMSLVSLTLFIAPTLIIGGCYLVIVATIWSQSGALRQGPTCGSSSSPGTAAVVSVTTATASAASVAAAAAAAAARADTRRASSRGLIPRAKIKTVKMTFVIVFVFVLCWSPYIIFDLLQVYGHIPKTQTNIAVASFIQSLAPLNSAANPIIYCLFSTPLCKSIRNVHAISWVSGWCPVNSHRRFGSRDTTHHPTRTTRTVRSTRTTRTTVTTSLMAHSSRRSAHIAMLHPTTRKRVMVSLV